MSKHTYNQKGKDSGRTQIHPEILAIRKENRGTTKRPKYIRTNGETGTSKQRTTREKGRNVRQGRMPGKERGRREAESTSKPAKKRGEKTRNTETDYHQ